MNKNIVLLSDGTGNSAGKLFKTNVWRLYQALALSPPGSGAPKQIAYYDDGVGSSSFKLAAIVGGAFGWGLKRNVLDLYTFLCRNYEPGDRIYAFGFSRGAFTVRVLSGLITSQGLVAAASETELKRRALHAFQRYRERYRTPTRVEIPLRALRNLFTGYRTRAEPVADERRPDIAFLGVWDTVAAYGLPFDELTRAWNMVFRLSVPDRHLSAKVKRACQALALDDERKTFHPVLWNELDQPDQNTTATHIDQERLTQVWFAGAHSNVGGSYADDALANVPLHWMMQQAKKAGVVFKDGEIEKTAAAANIYGRIYDSRRAFGGAYRYLPRDVAVASHDIDNKNDHVVVMRPKIHESVLYRIAAGTDRYAPIGLPPRYAVVTTQGDIHDMPAPGLPAIATETPADGTVRCMFQQKVWNLVFWRRIVYYLSVYLAVALVVFPLLFTANGACVERLCGISWVIRDAGIVLPAVFSPWLDSYAEHPSAFLLVVALFAAVLSIGGRLKARIADAMRAVWLRDRTLAPPRTDWLIRLRTSRWYLAFGKAFRRVVFPMAAGIGVLWLIAAAATQLVFAVMSSAGAVCAAGAGARDIFTPSTVCWDTGTRVEQGATYRITLQIADAARWTDGGIVADATGFRREKMSWSLYPRVLFRRYMTEPWMRPVARIGEAGSDEYVLQPRVGESSDTALVAEITARRSGELFLFVNDAVLPVPNTWQPFYADNTGAATVKVERSR
ncbi:MAG: DUF2235 domain-containing protein [Rhodospirillaceae bacterium]